MLPRNDLPRNKTLDWSWKSGSGSTEILSIHYLIFFFFFCVSFGNSDKVKYLTSKFVRNRTRFLNFFHFHVLLSIVPTRSAVTFRFSLIKLNLLTIVTDGYGGEWNEFLNRIEIDRQSVTRCFVSTIGWQRVRTCEFTFLWITYNWKGSNLSWKP